MTHRRWRSSSRASDPRETARSLQRSTQRCDAFGERSLIQQMIDAVRHRAKAFGHGVAAPVHICREHAGRLAITRGGSDDRIDAGEKARMRELSGNSKKAAQIEVTKPQDVDAWYRGNRIDVGNAALGFDERHDHRSLVDLRHF